MILGAAALLVLGGAWLVRRRRAVSGTAASSRILVALARDASPDAGEWPRAMLAEHDAIDDPRGRARFARGALVALLRGMHVRRAARRMDVVVVGACVAAACVLAATSLVRYPGLRVGTSWLILTVLFLLGLACYVVGALALSAFGSSRDHVAGAAVGLPALLVGWLAASAADGISVLLASAMILVPALAVVIDRAIFRARATAWVAGLTCALTTGLAFFVGFVAATLAANGGRTTAALLAQARQSGIHPFAAWSVGDALGGASFMLLYVLVVGGLIGLGAGASFRHQAA